jgi:hypothetical protein
MEPSKICLRCKVDKPLQEYRKHNAKADKLTIYCKDCLRDTDKLYEKNNRQKINDKKKRIKYKLTKETYSNLMLVKQCSICKSETGLCIDHDHRTGNVRGLLCNSCNIGLGFFKDDLQLLKTAIKYLKQTN